MISIFKITEANLKYKLNLQNMQYIFAFYYFFVLLSTNKNLKNNL